MQACLMKNNLLHISHHWTGEDHVQLIGSSSNRQDSDHACLKTAARGRCQYAVRAGGRIFKAPSAERGSFKTTGKRRKHGGAQLLKRHAPFICLHTKPAIRIQTGHPADRSLNGPSYQGNEKWKKEKTFNMGFDRANSNFNISTFERLWRC